MKHQIVMGPSGEIALAIPLYCQSAEETLAIEDKWVIAFSTQKPVGYALDMGTGTLQLVNAEVVEARCEFLGDL